MEILAAYDLTGSFRDAAALVGCDHHTVARYVRARDAGQVSTALQRRDQLVDPFREKIEELVDASHGRIRADVAQRKLTPMGYAGSDRTLRRAIAEAKALYRAGHRRRFRPWLPEPGLWFQWDYADGPLVEERRSWLWCAWLAWSKHRVVLPIRDKTLPTVIACIDVTLRRFGGVPTYGLSDNEKTLTLDHIARIAVRHPTMVEVGHHYGLTLASCVPADPQSKGGSEATVRIASADLVPTDANLRRSYTSFAELRVACDEFCERSIPDLIAPPAAHRTNAWPRSENGCIRYQPSPSRPCSASRVGWARNCRSCSSRVASTRCRMSTSARTSGCASKTTRSSSSTSAARAHTRSHAGSPRCKGSHATIQLTSVHSRRD